MNQLDKKQQMNENLLQRGRYFESFFQEACRANILSISQTERIQFELVELMAKEVERYTNDESSSIPVERANQLLRSVTYSMGYFLKTIADMTQKIDMLKSMKMSEMFYKGMDGVSACKKRAELILKDIQNNSIKLNNYAFQDSVFTGIPEFFHDYNIEFGANESPGYIDYPLFETITDYSGVEFIYEYLRRLSTEQELINHYSEEVINKLLLRFDKDAEHMLINIYELVLTNALGCILLGKKSTKLEIEENENLWLYEQLQQLELTELKKKLESVLYELKDELLLETESVSYALAAIPQIAVRLEHNLQTNTLAELFILNKAESVQVEFFEDGQQMDDEQLRILIEKLRDYRITSEKIAIIKDTVRSQVDFIELLNDCFYEEEYEEVFASLSDLEKSVLKKSIMLEAGQDHYEDYEPLNEWQKILFQLI